MPQDQDKHKRCLRTPNGPHEDVAAESMIEILELANVVEFQPMPGNQVRIIELCNENFAVDANPKDLRDLGIELIAMADSLEAS